MPAPREIDLVLTGGEFVVLLGPSGAGKTTTLNLIGWLDRPTGGRLVPAGNQVYGEGVHLSESSLDALRRRHIGFVFSDFYLLPTLTIAENVALPLLFAGRKDPQRVRELCERVGVKGKLKALPSALDGGEMQRVAIARALVNEPKLLLADEPTGRLERKSRDAIVGIFKELKQDGVAIVLATHDLELAARCDRLVELRDGSCVPSSWNQRRQ